MLVAAHCSAQRMLRLLKCLCKISSKLRQDRSSTYPYLIKHPERPVITFQSSVWRHRIAEVEIEWCCDIYHRLNGRQRPLGPESHLWSFLPHFPAANLYTCRGYAKTSIIPKDERSVIFWYRSSVPIILKAFEMWGLTRPSYERDERKEEQWKCSGNTR